MLLPVEPGVAEGNFREFPDGTRLSGGNDEIVGLGHVKHANHRIHVVRGVSPIDDGVEIAKQYLGLLSRLDGRNGADDFLRDKARRSPGRLMVVKDSRNGKKTVRASIVPNIGACQRPC